ncbi:MAG TPA: hypothetical protein DCE78_07780 [Bacteroidetes bacterium]|nr:hypothetical protein [Bacteroidota bacterium]
MSNTTKARKYNSTKLQELLNEISPIEMEQSKNKMQLATRMEDFMIAKGWNKSKFAEVVGKNPSEITKWLSGTQNFTIDTLTEIAFALGIELSSLMEKQQDQFLFRKEIAVKSEAVPAIILVTTPLGMETSVYGLSYVTLHEMNSSYSHLRQSQNG